MLARPEAIADGVAIACSGAAATKFALLPLAMLAALLALPAGSWSRLRRG